MFTALEAPLNQKVSPKSSLYIHITYSLFECQLPQSYLFTVTTHDTFYHSCWQQSITKGASPSFLGQYLLLNIWKGTTSWGYKRTSQQLLRLTPHLNCLMPLS
ncbi:hypothetical protein ACB098_08G115000 [Castanea mollissima]